ncbi:MAG: hypothetical protein PHF37_11090, partial [Phycisphaerae bacterium]|nr:hypothetical protein [Phycisphaerae bacterium]
IRIITARKRVLQYLDMMYPSPMKCETLFQSILYVDPGLEPALFKKDVYYLKDKEYIEFVDEKIGGFASFYNKVIKLTAKGKEIAEQTLTDPALEI